MEHLTLEELREREDYYNKYVLTNPYLSIWEGWSQLGRKYSEYADIRYGNGILVNHGQYVLNKKGIK